MCRERAVRKWLRPVEFLPVQHDLQPAQTIHWIKSWPKLKAQRGHVACRGFDHVITGIKPGFHTRPLPMLLQAVECDPGHLIVTQRPGRKAEFSRNWIAAA